MDQVTRWDIERAAERLIDAFAATDTSRYFDAFAEDATFVFHTEAHRLENRAAYEKLWTSWFADGWRVVSCSSSNARIQLLGLGAVFTHDVETVTRTGNGPEETTRERETIVFQRSGGVITAVHEHLSPLPDARVPEGS
ncbi:YybH family protein [Arthrobacter sp. TMN-37]